MYVKLTIPERLKDLRAEKGLTLDQLAEATGLSKAALGRYETDVDRDISPYSFSVLADFYGVSPDYLMCLSEQRNHADADIQSLHLSDGMIGLLRSGEVNNRLLCEIAAHEGFRRLMADMEIYVDRLASMQITNLNALLDVARLQLEREHNPDRDDLYRRALEVGSVGEDEYFSYVVRDDLLAILRDIREAHKKDGNTAPEQSHIQTFLEEVRQVVEGKGSPEERELKALCGSLGITYDKLTPAEVVTMVQVLKKSDLTKMQKGRRNWQQGKGRKKRR